MTYDIVFKRKISEARPFELEAFNHVRMVFFEKLSGNWDVFEQALKECDVSSQYLGKKTGENHLSVFFRYISVGGSGSTSYYILALKTDANPGRSYGLYLESDESGDLYHSGPNTETGYSIIGLKDRHGIQEFQFVPEIFGYLPSTAELKSSNAVIQAGPA
jgi:hypothetical protein